MKDHITFEEFKQMMLEIDEKLGNSIRAGGKAAMNIYHAEVISTCVGVLTKMLLLTKDEDSHPIRYDEAAKEGLINWQTWQLVQKHWDTLVEKLPDWLFPTKRDITAEKGEMFEIRVPMGCTSYWHDNQKTDPETPMLILLDEVEMDALLEQIREIKSLKKVMAASEDVGEWIE